MRNSFNLLLVALACFDNVYLFGGILEAVHRSFGVESKAHVILFPYVLYPIHAIGMTGSVLLTVAIALERCGCGIYRVLQERGGDPISYIGSRKRGNAESRTAQYVTVTNARNWRNYFQYFSKWLWQLRSTFFHLRNHMPQCNKSSQRNLTYKLQDTILPQGIQYPGQQEKRENAPNWCNYFHHFSSRLWQVHVKHYFI